MSVTDMKTPGVYINELDAFSNTIAPVETAVPAFVGYTPKASYEGKSYLNKAIKISSFQDFEAFFLYDQDPTSLNPIKQYTPIYYLTHQKNKPDKGKFFELNDDIYTLDPDPNTVYYLYNSVRAFYQNGGGDAYIVSVGTYGEPAGTSLCPGEQIINDNVELSALEEGLNLLKNEQEPTMYVFPEATLLTQADNSTLMKRVLEQCESVQTCIAIFDVIGANDPNPVDWMQNIDVFRENVGNSFLKYGTAYYPFVGSTITSLDEIDFTNIYPGDLLELNRILSPASAPNSSAEAILEAILNPSKAPLSNKVYNTSLCSASKEYSQIMTEIQRKVNLLPPSGIMAGVMTTVDNNTGVWNAPANVAPSAVASLPIYIDNEQQENLNVDATSGKSINAIRFFNGQGILIWGARTLDGNSQDWRYLSVRRTMTFIEQSVKAAARAYVFEPNDANTWNAVKAMIDNFLTSIWKEGALQGVKPEDAFSVSIGLGSTMTAQDILDGFMKVTIKVAVVHPAEFIILTFQQQQAKS